MGGSQNRCIKKRGGKQGQQCYVIMEEEAIAKKCGQPLEAGKDIEQILP